MSTQKLRIVCISDTHNAAPGQGYTLPAGDILIHAGDFTNQGSLAEIQKATSWLETADFAVKILVAGNHDLSLDPNYALKHGSGWTVVPEQAEECRRRVRQVKGVIYLEHESVVLIVKGVEIRVFGSPFSPDSENKQNWAFQCSELCAEELWEQIPERTDVLVTHCPPAGHVDRSLHWAQGGCAVLAQTLARVKPLLHVCGHCHEGRGAEVVRWTSEEGSLPAVEAWHDPGQGNKRQSLFDLTGSRGGQRLQSGEGTAIVNASIMAKSWGRGNKAFNKPIVTDIELPVKSDFEAA